LSSIKIKGLYPCQDIEHVYAMVRTSPRTTNVVRAGDQVPAGTMLVTPAIYWQLVLIWLSWIWHFCCRWSSVLLYPVCYHCSNDANAFSTYSLS